MVHSRRRVSAVAVGASTLLCLATVSGIVGTSAAGAATSSGKTMLAGSAVTAKIRQHPVGGVAKSARVDFNLVLKLRDAAGAQALLRAVSSPGSPSYRHYLTTAQWEARFSPAASEVRSARAWLHSEGFKVGAVSKDRITVAASGTAGQVENAFGTGLANYRVAGHTVRLATRDLSIPTSLARNVVGAMGVNQSIATAADSSGTAAAATASRASGQKVVFPPAPPAFITAKPCGAYYNQKIATVMPPYGHGYPAKVPYEVCGYKPGQFRSAYNVGSATGKGVTVAIVDAYGSATIASDMTRYFNMNDPGNPFANAHFSQLLATPFHLSALYQDDCDPASWLVEQAIDVDSVHSMARNANVLYVGAKSCFDTDLFKADQTVIDGRLADVVTNSWGDTGGDLLDDVATRTAFDDIFMLGDSTGMTLLYSTGDDGDNFNLLGLSAADYPAVSPYVTGMGGTSLQIGSKGQVIGTLGWATGRSFKCTPNAVGELPGCTKSTLNTWLPVTFDGGSGGFTSYNYTQPWYQAPVVPASLSTRNEFIIGPAPYRVVPDISMDADPSTGILVGYHQTFPNGKARYLESRWGGTSVASPLMAGVIADVDGIQLATGGSDVGFINPAIYRLVRRPGAINDVVPGGLQGQLRVDHAFTYIQNGKGLLYSFRELTYEGTITYCDATGNCASRPNTLSTAKGYDSMTGLGTIGPNFITDLGSS
jgi:subtilase family serine protease